MTTQRLFGVGRMTTTRPLPVLVIGNRNASGARDVRSGAVASAIRAAGGRVETVCTGSSDELAEVWPRDPERRVVLVGGDGSVHAAANMPGPRPEVALIPAGGANNIATSLGIPSSVVAAAEIALRGVGRPIDLIRASTPVGEYMATEGLSIGYLARARRRYRAPNSSHPVVALRAGAEALASHRPMEVSLEIDGRAERRSVTQLFVANLPLYGPRLRVAPHADPDDGLLDLVTLGARGRAGVVRMMRDLRNGRHRPALDEVQRAGRVRISTNGASPIFADSTDLGFGPVELRAEPRALRIVVPA